MALEAIVKADFLNMWLHFNISCLRSNVWHLRDLRDHLIDHFARGSSQRNRNNTEMSKISILINLVVLPDGSDGKESVGSVGDQFSIPWWGRYPGEENDNPLQYPCLENPVDRGAWWTTVHRVADDWATN